MEFLRGRRPWRRMQSRGNPPRLEPPFLLGELCAWWSADTGVTAADAALQEPNTWPGTQWTIRGLTPAPGQPDPVGGSDATQFLETTGAAENHDTYQVVDSSDLCVTGPTVLAVRAKSIGGRWLGVRDATYLGAKFDIVDGTGAEFTVGTGTATLTSLDDGWYLAEMYGVDLVPTNIVLSAIDPEQGTVYVGDVAKGIYLYTAEVRQHRCSGWTSRKLSGIKLVAGPAMVQATDANQFFNLRDASSPGWSEFESEIMWNPLDVSKSSNITTGFGATNYNSRNAFSVVALVFPISAPGGTEYWILGNDGWGLGRTVANQLVVRAPAGAEYQINGNITTDTYHTVGCSVDFAADSWIAWIDDTEFSGSWSSGPHTISVSYLVSALRMSATRELVIDPSPITADQYQKIRKGMLKGIGWSLAPAEGDSAGSSEAVSIGAPLFSGAGSAAGTATVVGVGTSGGIVSGAGSAAGTSTATGVAPGGTTTKRMWLLDATNHTVVYADDPYTSWSASGVTLPTKTYWDICGMGDRLWIVASDGSTYYMDPPYSSYSTGPALSSAADIYSLCVSGTTLFACGNSGGYLSNLPSPYSSWNADTATAGAGIRLNAMAAIGTRVWGIERDSAVAYYSDSPYSSWTTGPDASGILDGYKRALMSDENDILWACSDSVSSPTAKLPSPYSTWEAGPSADYNNTRACASIDAVLYKSNASKILSSASPYSSWSELVADTGFSTANIAMAFTEYL